MHVQGDHARPVSLIFLPIIFIKGTQYGVMTGSTPLIATGSAGWAEDHVTAIIGAAQLVAGIAGMTIGGLLGDRLGAKWASILLLGGWLVLNATMFLAQPLWADSQFLTIFVIGWFSLDTLLTVATLPIQMRLCNRTVAATQFTLYMALNNFGATIGASLLGLTDRLGGLASLFGLLAIANLVAIAIMLVVRFPTRQIEGAVADQLPQGDGLVPALN